MRKMIRIFLEFANHIEESDINNAVEKMKKGIEGIKKSVYPLAEVTKIDNMKYDTYVSDNESVLYFVDEKTGDILYTRGVYSKEVNGEVRITLLPVPMGAVSYGNDGVPISEVFEFDITEVRKTDRVIGTLRPNGSIELQPIVSVRCAKKKETSDVEKYRNALKDVMDAFWDMSPLEYAKSRSLASMSDEEGEKVLDRARELLLKKV